VPSQSEEHNTKMPSSNIHHKRKCTCQRTAVQILPSLPFLTTVGVAYPRATFHVEDVLPEF